MWVTTPTLTPLLPITTPFPWRVSAVSAASSKNISGLGQAVLTALQSSPTNKVSASNPPTSVIPKGNGKKEQEVDNNNNNGKELTGSDILWALQKASAKKAQVKNTGNNKVVKKNGPGFGLKIREGVVDYEKVRPVIVKSDWATRLDDLEKRLQEFNSV